MNARQEHVLNRKLDYLHSRTPTIQPEANIQAAGNKPWQVISPGGIYQIGYPALDLYAVVLCSYQVPPGMTGALNALAIVHNGAQGSFVDNSGLAVWHLTINGSSVQGYENILSQLGSFENPLGTYVLLQENDLLQVWVGGPTFDLGSPNPPVGFPAALMAGYVCFGGQGTYNNPRTAAGAGNGQPTVPGFPLRGNGTGRYARGTNNGSPNNQFGTGPGRNRKF